MWFNSTDISVEKTNGERNNRPGNEFAQWQRRTRGLTRHLIKKVKNTPTRSIIFGKHERTITDDRKCAQENTDRLETVNSWDKIASGLQKTHRMTPLQRQDRCVGSSGVLCLFRLEVSNTLPTRQHLEFGQVHHSLMIYHSMLAGDR